MNEFQPDKPKNAQNRENKHRIPEPPHHPDKPRFTAVSPWRAQHQPLSPIQARDSKPRHFTRRVSTMFIRVHHRHANASKPITGLKHEKPPRTPARQAHPSPEGGRRGGHQNHATQERCILGTDEGVQPKYFRTIFTPTSLATQRSPLNFTAPNRSKFAKCSPSLSAGKPFSL